MGAASQQGEEDGMVVTEINDEDKKQEKKKNTKTKTKKAHKSNIRREGRGKVPKGTHRRKKKKKKKLERSKRFSSRVAHITFNFTNFFV
jgi:hypothetical protein